MQRIGSLIVFQWFRYRHRVAAWVAAGQLYSCFVACIDVSPSPLVSCKVFIYFDLGPDLGRKVFEIKDLFCKFSEMNKIELPTGGSMAYPPLLMLYVAEGGFVPCWRFVCVG